MHEIQFAFTLWDCLKSISSASYLYFPSGTELGQSYSGRQFSVNQGDLAWEACETSLKDIKGQNLALFSDCIEKTAVGVNKVYR